ncbi:MAG TPA: putative lipid II flippase FtsW [Solirubrobacterales bacterium]|nr:putative lipid II flippase FtsW [Solirubrobacterales bacterium]
MSARALSLGGLVAGRTKKRSKAKKKRSRAAAPSTEYSLLLTATLCLLALGAVMVFSASSTTQVLSDGNLANSAFYLKRTLICGALGLLVMHLTARHGLTAIRRLTPAFLVGSLFLLLLVLVAGTSANGASRWLGPGALQFQPSELAKVALILYGADLLSREPKRVRSLQGLMPFLLVVGTACLLIMAEPDMGTTMVIAFSVAATLIAAGARPVDIGKIALCLGGLALLLTVIEPYRMARLTGFLNPGAEAAGAGFQAAQAKIALGSGGLFGVGIGNGVQKAFYLPEAHTDMISAVIGEELGMIGILGVVGLFGLLGYAGLRVAQKARDRYSKLLVAGLTSMVLVQATINLFAVMGLAPLTGVPLPFVSYGNSSLLVTLFAVGLVLNVARGGRATAAARPGRASRAGKLRLVEGGRTNGARKRSQRSGSSRGKSAQSRSGSGRNRRPRRAGDGRRRRASG